MCHAAPSSEERHLSASDTIHSGINLNICDRDILAMRMRDSWLKGFKRAAVAGAVHASRSGRPC